MAPRVMALVAPAWFAVVAVASAQPNRYAVVNLGTLGGSFSDAIAINAAGHVVGNSRTASDATHAFRWDGTSMTDLGTLGGSSSFARDISASGQVVGWSYNSNGQSRAFVWNGSALTDLGTLGGATSSADAVNSSGDVVGSSELPNGQLRAFLWRAGTMTSLGTLGGEYSVAYGINDAGQVVGRSNRSAFAPQQTFLWQGAGMTDLGMMGGVEVYPRAINASGQITGFLETSPGVRRAFVWTGGSTTVLGTMGGSSSYGYGINASGHVVGPVISASGQFQAFLWDGVTMHDLTALLAASSAGWRIISADDINDAGQIAATGCHASFGCRALRLDPVGAPGPTYTRYLAEGATSSFFDQSLALLNPGSIDTTARLTFTLGSGQPITTDRAVPARTRVTVDPKTIAGLQQAEFATRVESDQPLVVDRTMTWAAGVGYGSHAETAVVAPSVAWYLAEGATHSGFSLFYLLQNPATTATDVRVRYLRPSGAPIEKTYTLPPTSRTNIWVNEEVFPGLGTALAATDVSAVIESLDATPIIVERAMYLSNQGRAFNAGHASAGVTAPATEWFLAEGATGSYFDLFVLIANPNDTAANVTVTYLLGDGTTYQRNLVAPPNSRSNIWVDVEEIPGVAGLPLANVAVSTTVTSTNAVPIIVERSMWWPGASPTWHEAHNSAGSTTTGTRWALAEGEVGGGRGVETYILIANTSASAGQASVTLLFEDGTSAVKTYPLPPQSRTNVPVAGDFPTAVNRRFGAVVESIGATPAQIVVERAMYSNSAGVSWAAGTNALATRLQ